MKNNFIFNMPDGQVLTKQRDVDRYYGLAHGTTGQRMHRGWTCEDCASNGNTIRRVFNMPDGSVFNRMFEVDEYYNIPRVLQPED